MNKIKSILVGLGILAVLLTAGFLFMEYKQRRDAAETTLQAQAQLRFEQHLKKEIILAKERDSISDLNDQKQALIDYLEHNPQVIIKQNNDAHISIDKLNAINTALLWTNNIAHYDSSRARYSLSRFGKTTP